MSEETAEVLVERVGAVLVITLNRPDVRNALNASVAAAVASAVDLLDASPDLRVAVLTGAGGTFSAGMDLRAFLRGELPMVPGRGLCGIGRSTPRKPLVAAVEGWAVAAGFELVLACDLVVASESARFALAEVKRGLVAGAGGAMILPRRVPRAVALEMLLTGDDLSAQRAEQIGLVNRLAPAGHALESALVLAGTIAQNGPLAVEATKLVAHSAADWAVDEGWARQSEHVRRVFASEDAKEGARAFAEKRPPRWQGR